MTLSRAQTVSQLARERGGALVLFARQWTEFPEDVVQEALIELFEAEPWPSNPTAWLYQVVRYRGLNQRRSHDRRRRHEQRSKETMCDWFVTDPAATLLQSDLIEALERLDGELRETVVARIWGGLSFEEIGRLTEVSASSACRRYAMALSQLRDRLDPPRDSSNRPTPSSSSRPVSNEVRS